MTYICITNKLNLYLMKTQLCKSMILLILLGIGMGGCHTGTKKATENDIQFDSIVVDKTYHFFNNPENPNCNLQICFTYPSKFPDKGVLKKLQKNFVLSYFGEEYADLSPAEATARYTDNYLKEYKELEKDFQEELKNAGDSPVGSWYSYYEMSNDDIVYNENDILSYTVNFENYTGGAHGAHAYANQVLNLKTGKPVLEEEIFVDNYQDNLARILIDQITQDCEVENPKELENVGFFSVDEIFPNGNFLVDGEGITYTFNEYEIAAYVIGPVKVTLPYEEIRYLLKKDSPIASIAF